MLILSLLLIAAADGPSKAVYEWKVPYRMAQLALASAAATDVASSWGCAEANPLLRSADGRFRSQGTAIKVGATAGSMLALHVLQRKMPKLRKPLTFAIAGSAGLLYGVSARNLRVPCW